MSGKICPGKEHLSEKATPDLQRKEAEGVISAWLKEPWGVLAARHLAQPEWFWEGAWSRTQ